MEGVSSLQVVGGDDPRGLDLSPAAQQRLADFVRIADLTGGDLFVSDGLTGQFVDCNRSAHERLGYSYSEMLALRPEAIQANPDHDAAWVVARRRALLEAGGGTFTTRHRCKDNTILDVRVRHTVLELDGRPLILSSVEDCTRSHRLERQLQEGLDLLAEGEGISGTGTWDCRLADGRMRWSWGVHRLCRTDPDSYEPTLWGYTTLVHPEDRPRWRREFQQAISRGEELHSRHRLAFLDGSELLVSLHAHVQLDGEGKPLRMVGTIGDSSVDQHIHQDLERQRHGDGLTGLPNKLASLQELNRRLSGRSYSDSLAVLSLDLDGFQEINDSFGAEIGDQLLQAIAARLRQLVGDQGWLARLSSDEFLVLQEVGIRSLGDAMALSRRLQAEWSQQPLLLNPLQLNPTFCIGIATYPEHAQDGQGLLQCANTALMQAKRSGRSQVCAYSSTLSRQIRERLQLDGELAQAQAREQLRLMVQPQVHSSGALVGGEVLLRWTNSRGVAVSPAQFIPLAEHSGLIFSLTSWVLRRSLEQLAVWRDQGLPLPPLALNISARHLELPGHPLVSELLDALEVHRLGPEHLELEITETALLQNQVLARDRLQLLADQGFRIAIDDFGTGYSSLELLRSLPVHKLKIDRTFIESLTTSAEDQTIVQATLTLARGLGMDCIAEGVETQAQQRLLEELGCELYQGYLYGRPMELQAFEQWLRDQADAAQPVPSRVQTDRRHAVPLQAASMSQGRMPSAMQQLELLRTAIDLGQDAYMLLRAASGPEGSIVDFLILDLNPAACQYFGQERDAFVGQMLLAIFPSSQTTGLLDLYASAVNSGNPLMLEDFAYPNHELFKGDRVYDINVCPINEFLVITWRDVSERSQVVRSLADAASLYRLLAESIVEVVLLVDDSQCIRWVSPSLQPMTGWTPRQWQGKGFRELFAAAVGQPEPVDLQEWLADYGALRQGRLRLADPRGGWSWVELSVRRIQNQALRSLDRAAVAQAGGTAGAGGEPVLQSGFVITLQPIDEQVLQEQRLLQLAHTDPLTGLETRGVILSWLERRLLDERALSAQPLALLFCDFDNFKGINDTYGHAGGDAVLQAVAQRIREVIRSHDHAGRMGGDEFLVLLDGIHSLDDALVVADKLRRAMEAPIPWGEERIQASLSIGVALHGAGEDADLFLRRADHSMYAAKAAGRCRVMAL